MTTTQTRALVYDLDRETKARFTEPTDIDLKAKARIALVLAETRHHDADTLRALIASCDRDIAAETAHALGLGHQARERAVPCRRGCGRDTVQPHAVCDQCGPETCRRCEAGL